MTTENQAPDPARDFLDDDGENRAVRAFLMLYGAGSPTAAQMAVHMRMSGFDVVPEWVERSPGHLTKGGAQLWLRQLFALEAIPAPEGAQLPPLSSGDLQDIIYAIGPACPTRQAFEIASEVQRRVVAALAAPAPTDNNAIGQAGCYPAAEKTTAAPAEAHGDVLVPLSVLEDASLAISAFVSDHGWGDEDMQAMDNLDAYIARHKANAATKVDTQPKGMPQQQAWVWNPASLAWEAVQTPWHRHSGALYAYGPTPPGLSLTQEPKYTVNGHAIVNRASGEEIPADEPVFIFRARDRWAAGVLGDYCGQFCNDPEHVAAVEARFIQFAEWAAAHPERMKEPDTAPASQPPVQGSQS